MYVRLAQKTQKIVCHGNCFSCASQCDSRNNSFSFDLNLKWGGISQITDEISDIEESSDAGEVSTNTENDLGVYTEDYWISDSSYYSTSWSGSGTSSAPYLIQSAEDLALLSYNVFISTSNTYSAVYFEQTCDIDLSEHYWMPIGGHCSTGSSTSYSFAGRYNGGGFIIKGITTYYGSESSTYSYMGLFGSVIGTSTSNAYIHDLEIEDSSVEGYQYVAAVAARASGLVIYNCYNSTNITANSWCAGLIVIGTVIDIYDCCNNGDVTATSSSSVAGGVLCNVTGSSSTYARIDNCNNTGSVSAVQAGGVIYYLSTYCNLSNCYNSGTITASSSAAGVVELSYGYPNAESYFNQIYNCYNVGLVYGGSCAGLCCESYASCFSNCYNASKIVGSGARVGGLIGLCGGNCIVLVCDCYNAGDVSSTNTSNAYVGGIVAYLNSASEVYNCYNTGSVTNSIAYTGGIAGYVNNGVVYSCYNSGSVTGASSTGGIAGEACGTSSSRGQIYNCYNTGEIVSTSSYTGGVCGTTYYLDISNCFNNGIINGTNDGVGGISGRAKFSYIYDCYNTGMIIDNEVGGGGIVGFVEEYVYLADCYNVGSVTAGAAAGGICGYFTYSTNYIFNCINQGNVVSKESGYETYVGGILGYYLDSYTISNCYYFGTIIGCGNVYTQGIGYDYENVDVEGQTEYVATLKILAQTTSWFADADSWNADYEWDFESVWAISEDYNDGYPYLLVFGDYGSGYERAQFDSDNGYWFYEDGEFPQSAVTDDDLISDLVSGASQTKETYALGSEKFVVWSFDGDKYIFVSSSGKNLNDQTASGTWFLVEPIKWVLGAGTADVFPTDCSTAVSASVVMLGSYVSSKTYDLTFVSLFNSTNINGEAAVSGGSLALSSLDSIVYDLFNTTSVSQTYVYSVNLGNKTDDNTVVTSAGYRVASINEIDALGGSYKATCSDLVAFLLSGGTTTSGYAVDYWTRDLAYSLDSSSYYGTSSYSGYYNNGVYVTSAGTISNALLSNIFGARLSLTI